MWLSSALIAGTASAVLTWLLFRDDLPLFWAFLAGLPIMLVMGLLLSFAQKLVSP